MGRLLSRGSLLLPRVCKTLVILASKYVGLMGDSGTRVRDFALILASVAGGPLAFYSEAEIQRPITFSIFFPFWSYGTTDWWEQQLNVKICAIICVRSANLVFSMVISKNLWCSNIRPRAKGVIATKWRIKHCNEKGALQMHIIIIIINMPHPSHSLPTVFVDFSTKPVSPVVPYEP